MLVSTSTSSFKLFFLSSSTSTVAATVHYSNFFGGKNQLRSLHLHQQQKPKAPLAGIKVTVLKQPFQQTPKLIPKLLKNAGAEITTFCDISKIKKQNIDKSWSNSDFVKSNVFQSFDQALAGIGEKEVNLRIKGDVRMIEKVATKSDIFIDGLANDNMQEKYGINVEEILKTNSKLIVARFDQSDPEFNPFTNFIGDKSDANTEEFLELARQHYKTQILLGEIACFSRILLTFLSRQQQQPSGNGQIILDCSISDALYQVDRIISTLPTIPKTFDRFYATKDSKVFHLCIPSFNDQQKFLKALNLTAPKDIPVKIRQSKYAELNALLKDVNSSADFDYFFHGYKSTKLQIDPFYEYDRKINHWMKNNFYHFSTSF